MQAENVAVEFIAVTKGNPRTRFDKALDAELAASVRQVGVLQPVLLRKTVKGGLELVCGHRRLAAAKTAGLTEVPAVVRELTDEQVLEIQIVENLQRSDVHPLDEADAYRQLHERYKHDVARIAERVGRSVAYVYDRMRLTELTAEAKEHFREGRIEAGHAVILARLKPKDQARAIDADNGGLFQDESLLWNPDDTDEKEAEAKPYHGLKHRTVRELQAWVDQHVKFDAAAADVPQLFPETARSLEVSKAVAEKVVHITREYQIQRDAHDGNRVLTDRSWKRADGTGKHKQCDKSVMGVVVIGPGRGEAFRVCADKTCKAHWAAEQRDAAKRKAAREAGDGAAAAARSEAANRRQKERLEKEKREEERWERARPNLIEAVRDALEGTKVESCRPLVEALVDSCGTYHFSAKSASKRMKRGETAEDLLRYLAFLEVGGTLFNWGVQNNFPPVAKALGIDHKAILDKAAPLEPAAPKAAKPAKRKAAKKTKSRRKAVA